MPKPSRSTSVHEGVTVKHVVVAKSVAGAPHQFLNKGRTSLKPNLADACLFDSPAVAERKIGKLVAEDWERKHGVTLVLGQVALTLLGVAEPAAKKAQSGFILRRGDGQYYCGPKGRNANSFAEAHYRYKPNPDVATVFKSELQAAERAEGILVELRKAVPPPGMGTDRNRQVYEQCVAQGHCEVIAL